ncbi:hypothetical protein DFH28DRAFT_2068 [Melampsora americana]|nr:hypothetical protein DFH28DRAFT_2068 [Melampsora americana]
MSSSPTKPNQNHNSSKQDESIAQDQTHQTTSYPHHHRSSSIFSSIISLAIPPNQNNFSPTNSPSSSLFSSPNIPTGTYSPTSSINPNSPQASMKDPELSSFQSTNPRRSSMSAFGSLTNGFRWSTAPNSTNPIPIPNSNSPQTETGSSDQMMGTSLPTRKVSGGSSFRRPFEFPHYSSVTEEEEAPNVRRGRSGSLFSSFGANPTRSESEKLKEPIRPRRKLSPMGERMLRDHPF